MNPLGIASLAIGGSSILGGFSAKKKARKQARANAQLIRMETAETIRRTREQDKQVLGQTIAIAGGAGVLTNTGTPDTYLKKMQSEQAKNIDWINKSAEQAIRAGRKHPVRRRPPQGSPR